VLTDPTTLSLSLRGGIISHRLWRFADLHTRLEYLLAGFGWCNMPLHMVADHIEAGRLKRLVTAERDGVEFRIHVVHERGREIGRAGRWLINDLRERMNGPVCESERRKLESRSGIGPAHARNETIEAMKAAIEASAATDEQAASALAESP
jgi:hypothetical protein